MLPTNRQIKKSSVYHLYYHWFREILSNSSVLSKSHPHYARGGHCNAQGGGKEVLPPQPLIAQEDAPETLNELEVYMNNIRFMYRGCLYVYDSYLQVHSDEGDYKEYQWSKELAQRRLGPGVVEDKWFE